MKVWTLIPVLALAVSSWARIFYVDNGNPQANNVNAGISLSAPWKTMAKAAATLVAGDTVLVRKGTYNEDVIAQNAGTALKNVLYRNYGTDSVVVTGRISLTGMYIEVAGFECSGGNGRIDINGAHNLARDNYVHHATNGNGLNLSGSDNTARYNRVANCGAGWGDNAGMSGSNNLFEYNEVSDPEQQGEDLMKFGGFNHIIRNNYFHDLYEHGRHDDVFQAGFTTTDNILIQNNLITRVGGQVAMLSPWSGTLRNFTFRNNLIIMNQSHGWCFNGDTPDVKFINNTFIAPGMAVINFTTTGLVVKNNIFYDPSSDGKNSCTYPTSLRVPAADYNIIYPNPTGMWGCPGVKPAHEQWGAIPKFVNAANNDYHLAAGSPAIDAGTADSASATDKDGRARFDDPATANKGGGTYAFYDIGAYEYTNTGIRTLRPGSGQAAECGVRNALPGQSLLPNPLTRAALIELSKENGWELFGPAGNHIALNRVQGNGVYFLGTARQAVRKIMVVE